MTTAPKPTLVIEDGTQGFAERFDKEFLHIRCTRAYPPGRPLNFKLHVGEQEMSLSGRCIGSKKQAEGDFAVRLRMTNLRREDRLWLIQNLSG